MLGIQLLTQLSVTPSSLIHKFKIFSLHISEFIAIEIEAFSNYFALQVVNLDLIILRHNSVNQLFKDYALTKSQIFT